MPKVSYLLPKVQKVYEELYKNEAQFVIDYFYTCYLIIGHTRECLRHVTMVTTLKEKLGSMSKDINCCLPCPFPEKISRFTASLIFFFCCKQGLNVEGAVRGMIIILGRNSSSMTTIFPYSTTTVCWLASDYSYTHSSNVTKCVYQIPRSNSRKFVHLHVFLHSCRRKREVA